MIHNRMKKNLILLLDGELDESKLLEVEDHINSCNKCKIELDKLLEMKQMVIGEQNNIYRILHSGEITNKEINNLETNSSKWLDSGIKKKAVIISAFVLLFAFLFIPYSGQTLAQNIEEWFKSITVVTKSSGNKELGEYEYIADLDSQEIYNEKETFASEKKAIYGERDKKIEELASITDKAEYEKMVEKIKKEARNKVRDLYIKNPGMAASGFNYVHYKTVEEVKEKTNIEIPIPKYIPINYRISKIYDSEFIRNPEFYYKYHSIRVEFDSDKIYKIPSEGSDIILQHLELVYNPRVEQEKFHIERDIRSQDSNMSEDKIREMVDNSFIQGIEMHYENTAKFIPISIGKYNGKFAFWGNTKNEEDSYRFGISILRETDSIGFAALISTKKLDDASIKCIEDELLKVLESCLEL